MTASFETQATNDGSADAQEVVAWAREDRAALFRLLPEALELLPEDADEHQHEHDAAGDEEDRHSTGCSEIHPNSSENEPGTERKR